METILSKRRRRSIRRWSSWYRSCFTDPSQRWRSASHQGARAGPTIGTYRSWWNDLTEVAGKDRVPADSVRCQVEGDRARIVALIGDPLHVLQIGNARHDDRGFTTLCALRSLAASLCRSTRPSKRRRSDELHLMNERHSIFEDDQITGCEHRSPCSPNPRCVGSQNTPC